MSAQTWWYLSFCDPDIAATIPEGEQRPGGPSWLGACYVPAETDAAAVWMSHLLGCNPGGEVKMYGPLSEAEMNENVPQDKRCRLLNLEEVDA